MFCLRKIVPIYEYLFLILSTCVRFKYMHVLFKYLLLLENDIFNNGEISQLKKMNIHKFAFVIKLHISVRCVNRIDFHSKI